MKRVALLTGIILLTASVALSACSVSKKSPGTEKLDEVLELFDQIAAIPHPSKHEEAIGTFLCQWAADRGFDATRDAVGNVIFDVPATKGHESSPLVVLQGHMDMVVVSKSADFDPLSDTVTPIREGDEIHADGTSLGADNGIGVASIMTYAASNAEHGPLRIIITVEEETTQIGVQSIDPSLVADASYLINVDSETEGSAIISSAAGATLTARQDARTTTPSKSTAITMSLTGLQGGHSGVMIGEGRLNAATAMGDALALIGESGIAFELASFDAGSAPNAIPAEAQATIVVDEGEYEAVQTLVTSFMEDMRAAYAASDGGLSFSIAPAQMPQRVLTSEQAMQTITYISTLTNGIVTMSQEVDDLVESSSNIGVVQVDESGVQIISAARSSKKGLMDSIIIKQLATANSCGFEADYIMSCKSWPVDTDSHIASVMKDVYKSLTNKEFVLECIHAGLECGEFITMNPNLDMIAIGPQIDGGHTVEETVSVPSIVTFYDLLAETLVRLC